MAYLPRGGVHVTTKYGAIQFGMPPETVKASLPLIANFLKSDSVVVHTYAAAAVEKFLIMKVGGVGSTQALVTAQDLAPQAQTLLQSLFDVLSR